ncbi:MULTISPECIES: hypothetical protein [unclassified Rathayibacter]|nr:MULTISPECIES: hypothetical protein [unclassified Rathayibacter]
MIDPESLLDGAGPWAIAVVCLIVISLAGIALAYWRQKSRARRDA